MKLSISTTFLLLGCSQATSIASAILSPGNGNQQFNNNSVSTPTVTVTASSAATTPVTTSTSSRTNNNIGRRNGNNNGNNNNGNNNGSKNNGNNTTGGTNNVGSSNSGSTNSTATNAGSSNSSNGSNGATNTNNPQSSLTLDPKVIGPNIGQNGQASGADPGQVASLTSTNNYINFCLGKTITNGQQVVSGSCNSIPMGDIPSENNMVSCKITQPLNMETIQSNKPFKIEMAVQGLITGNFVNPNTNYFSAPQQLDPSGQTIGHSHLVVQKVKSFQDTSVLDPKKFDFFTGVNAAAVGNSLSVTVAKGLPQGCYRIASMNTAANHQPVISPVAQHGHTDDMIVIDVSDNGVSTCNTITPAAGTGATGQANNGTSTSSTRAAASTGAANNGGTSTSSTSAAASTGAANNGGTSTSSTSAAASTGAANNGGTSTSSTSSAKNSAAPSASGGSANTTSIVGSSSAALSSSAVKATATTTNGTSSAKGSQGKGGRRARRFMSSRIARV